LMKKIRQIRNNTRMVEDSLLGRGIAYGKPFVVDGEELILVKFNEHLIPWKTEELRRTA
jgi:hypothetical protein